MIKREELLPVGKFQKTHALKGELNMISELVPEYYSEGGPLIVNDDGIFVPYYVETIRPKGNISFLVKIKGVNSEEEASAFVNKEIFMLKKDCEKWLPEDYEDAEELIGYSVWDENSGERLGVIVNIDNSTPNILFIIEGDNEEELILPGNEDFITEIDDDKKEIRMNLPEGLREIN